MGYLKGIDSLAYDSRALQWPPLGKLSFSICLLIGSLSSRSLRGPLVVLGVGLFLFLYSTRGKLPASVLALIGAVTAFNVVGVAIIALTQPGTPAISLPLPWAGVSVTHEGLALASLVFLRTSAGLFVMLFFAASTPIPHVFASLKSLGLPDDIAEITVLVYRYSFMVLELSEQMMGAAGCRLGFSGWRNSMRTTGIVAANLFIRSLELAERSRHSLQSRNFTGSFPLFREPQRMTPGWALLSAAALACACVAGNP